LRDLQILFNVLLCFFYQPNRWIEIQEFARIHDTEVKYLHHEIIALHCTKNNTFKNTPGIGQPQIHSDFGDIRMQSGRQSGPGGCELCGAAVSGDMRCGENIVE